MGSSLRIAKPFGIDVKVHFTFLLVLALGAYQWGRFGVSGALFGIGLTALLFLCVTLHELGHSVVAMAFGIPVKEITLLPIGGVAMLTKKPKKPLHELLIALAGPAVNVAIAGGLWLLGALWLGEEQLVSALTVGSASAPSAETLWASLLWSNVLVAAFNMLPALPMDGGRVFRAVLTWILGPSRATKAAALLGRVLAAGLFAWGFKSNNPMLMFIAVFIFFAAGAEVADQEQTEQLEQLAHVRAGEAVNPHAVGFGPDTPLGGALRALGWSAQTAFPVMHFGRLVGVVTRAALLEALQKQGPYAYVAGVMQREVPRIDARATLDEARLKMNEAHSPFVAAWAGDEFVGLITELELAHQAALGKVLQKFGGVGPAAPRKL